MKKDRRGLWWKNISPLEREIRMAYVVGKRWAKTTPEQRKAYSKMMNEAKKKNLSPT